MAARDLPVVILRPVMDGAVGEVSLFRAERATGASAADVRWVVVDRDWALQVEASAFLASLRALDRSPNTERAYASRVALFLSYCASRGVSWTEPSFLQLAGFLHWLVQEPIATGRSAGGFRSKATANAIFTAVSEFLRFGTRQGWVSPSVPAMLTEPRLVRYVPPGFDGGENGQFRTVHARTIKFRVAESPPSTLRPEQVDRLLSLVTHARDRFLLMLMLATGIRIGEALGLARFDLHLLARSDMLGCAVAGPHLHIERRLNPNGALAKSRYPRVIPVTTEVVDAYADYQFERTGLAVPDDDAVFVNLFREPIGAPMRYSTAKDMVDRLSRRCGFPVRPHMLRHTAATGWIEAGTPPDVVQALLGHVSFASTGVYFHASPQRMRQAVEMTAAKRPLTAPAGGL